MKKWIINLFLMCLLVSCTENPIQNTVQPTVNKPTATITPFSLPEIKETLSSPISTPTESIHVAVTEEVKNSLICPLFKDEGLENLMERITNPFYRPVPGSDNPHQGVDFGDLDPVNRIALSGKAVNAITAGQVAMVLEDRFPYGNAILIEVPLTDLPDSWQTKLNLDQTIQREILHTNLSCPDGWEEPSGDLSKTSFYILYAHFEEGLNFQVGDSIQCGQEIGKIGMTGNALAPHVHVEMRLGPAGVVFEDMAHYDPGASLLAMENYCRWRVSGWYELLDPMTFFLIQ